MLSNINKKYIKYGVSATLSILGFRRGIFAYDYRYQKYNYDRPLEKREPIFYSSKIMYGFVGVVAYMNPFFWPVLFAKEIYRLEVNIRDLKNEKTTDFYNELL